MYIRKQRPLTRPDRGVSQPADTRAAEEKKRLRPLCRARMKSIAGETREASERAILDALYGMPEFDAAPLVCGYIPLPGEIDLFPVWRKVAALDKRMAFPCLTEGIRDMIFREVPGYDPACLVAGPHKTRQPAEDCPAVLTADFSDALILVPGLSFDDRGIRLGYGGGYYDRFLRDLYLRHIPVTTVGLVFADCRGVELPRQSHDVPVDYVISEGRITITHAKHDAHLI